MRIFHRLGRMALTFASAAGLLTAAAVARAQDPAACARAMVRLTFEHNTPSPMSRDPRGRVPPEMTAQERRALHAVLWPSAMSVRFRVAHWLRDKNFDCLEEAFADLEATQPRFPSGMLKQVEFLGGARDYVAQRRGMTEAEIAELMSEWRGRHPRSLLAELMWPRLLMGAAWEVRGSGFANQVSPENMQAFQRLNAAALKQLHALSSAAPKHVMGHYVALRGISDNGAALDQISRFAVEAMRRFPQEAPLASIAGERMLPRWGGSPEVFEAFASAVGKAVGPALADRTYAYLYTRAVGWDELHNFASAQFTLIRRGLMAYADGATFDEIVQLQHYACARRDAAALRRAQALWRAYEREPQLRPPADELDSECRQWERTLAPSAPQAGAAPAPAPAVAAAPAVPAPPAAPAPSHPTAVPMLYSVAPGPWDRFVTPVGEVYSCKVCEYPVQVLFALGPELGADAPHATHEKFLHSIQTAEQQTRLATELLAPMAPQSMGSGAVTIERTGFGELGGLRAFQYDALVKIGPRSMHESATVVVVRNRMLRVAVNRHAGPVGSKEQAAVKALLAGIRLAED